MWITVTEESVRDEFTPQEQAALTAIQGAAERLPGIVERAVAAARGAIRAGGYALGEEGTLPDELLGDVIALARWRWLLSFPQMQRLQTAERQAAHDRAQARLEAVARQRLGVQPPAPGRHPASGEGRSRPPLPGRMDGRPEDRRGHENHH